MRFIRHFLTGVLAIALTSTVSAKTVSDVLEVSRRNLQGHKSLYNEGWFIITSSKDAIEASRSDSTSASHALQQALQNVSQDHVAFSDKVSRIKDRTAKQAQEFHDSGVEKTQQIFKGTKEIWNSQWTVSKDTYAKAYSKFTLGYLTFGQTMHEDWTRIRKANQDFVQRTTHPFNDQEMKLLLDDTYQNAEKSADEGIWSKALTKATDEFHKSYEKSGESHNSLSGLGIVLWGHLKAAYYGFIKPTAATTEVAAIATANGAKTGATYLLAGAVATTKIIGDVVFTTGLNLYYMTAMGYHVFAPTIEGGLLGSLALANMVSMPAIYTGGTTLGAFNQVAVTTITPAVGTGQYAIASSLEGAKYAASMTYDLAKGTGEAIVHESHAGVVLGYNMLTQIPAQTLLGVANGVVLLVYDGPHLALVVLRGEVDGVTVQEVPVGTIVDVKAIESTTGIQSQKLEASPELLEKIFGLAPLDFNSAKETK